MSSHHADDGRTSNRHIRNLETGPLFRRWSRYRHSPELSNQFPLYWSGGLTQDQIIAEYQQADVFLATGYPEGFGLPTIEAMNCGCVVVGFTGGGAREYMFDGETALVADDGYCETAAAKLMQVLKDDVLKENLWEKGHQKALTFTEKNTERLLETFFRPLVS